MPQNILGTTGFNLVAYYIVIKKFKISLLGMAVNEDLPAVN